MYDIKRLTRWKNYFQRFSPKDIWKHRRLERVAEREIAERTVARREGRLPNDSSRRELESLFLRPLRRSLFLRSHSTWQH